MGLECSVYFPGVLRRLHVPRLSNTQVAIDDDENHRSDKVSQRRTIPIFRFQAWPCVAFVLFLASYSPVIVRVQRIMSVTKPQVQVSSCRVSRYFSISFYSITVDI